MSGSAQPVARPTPEAMRRAAERLRGVVVPTPLVPHRGDPEHGAGILLKPEIHQPVGSFKLRGVYNAVAEMTPEERAAGVSTVSAGNTAQALAWSARRFGVPARSLMPETAPKTKIEAVRALGGTPVLVPVDELFRYLREHGWEAEPYGFVHPWTSPAMLTGHASLGLEILAARGESPPSPRARDDSSDQGGKPQANREFVEDFPTQSRRIRSARRQAEFHRGLLAERPGIDTVYVPVGGGGLIAGVGSAIRQLAPEVKVIAVEPEGCPSLSAALDAGKPVTVDCKTICDGVAVPYITDEMFPLLSGLIDRVVRVDEPAVRAAIRSLALDDKIVAEPAGALALAAALATPADERGEAVAIVSGGSIDRGLLIEILGEEPA